MLSFLLKMTVPPGGRYFYFVEETGVHLTALDMPALLKEVRSHYRQHGLESPANLEAVIEDYMCHNLPDGFCKGDTDKPKKKFLSIRQIAEGTRVLMEKYTSSPEEFFVSEAEATRRARVCANCPYHKKGACVSCNEGNLKTLAKKLLTGRRRTIYDEQLDTCGVCGCLIRVKVHVSLKALAVTQKHNYPDNCWLHGTACHDPERDE